MHSGPYSNHIKENRFINSSKKNPTVILVVFFFSDSPVGHVDLWGPDFFYGQDDLIVMVHGCVPCQTRVCPHLWCKFQFLFFFFGHILFLCNNFVSGNLQVSPAVDYSRGDFLCPGE